MSLHGLWKHIPRPDITFRNNTPGSAPAPARDGLEGLFGVLRQDEVVPAQLWSV